MKSIVKISGLIIFIVFFACSVEAQHCNANRLNVSSIIEMLQKHVEISEDQSVAISEILSLQKSKLVELKSSYVEGNIREHIKSAIQQIKADTDEAITEILTDEQVVLYEEIKTKRKLRGGKNWGKGNCCEEKGKTNRGEIKAKFLAMRVELEEAISRRDKKKIKSLRKTMQAAKAEKKAFFTKWKSNERMPSKDEMKAALQTLKEKYAEEKEAVSNLTKKYHEDIRAIFEQNQVGRLGKGFCGTKGKNGAKAFCEMIDKQNCCTNEANTPACCKGKMNKKSKMKARFLLMDPKGAGEDVSKAEIEEVELSTVKISPNPAKAKATIAYEVKNEGIIKIDVVDESGNIVVNLLNEYKKEGIYQVNLNTNALQSKMYFIAIRDGVGVNNEKLLINKR